MMTGSTDVLGMTLLVGVELAASYEGGALALATVDVDHDHALLRQRERRDRLLGHDVARGESEEHGEHQS